MDNRYDEESQTPLLHEDTLQKTHSKSNNSSTDSIALNPAGLCTSTNSSEADESGNREDVVENSRQLLYLQATVLFEDAINYRSIHHKMDKFSIFLYRWYHSNHVHWALNIATYLLLLLAFFETPSSLVWSSDPRLHLKRTELPSGLAEGIELMCLLIIFISLFIQSYLTSDVEEKKTFPKKHPWLTGGFIVVILSFIDLTVSLIIGNVHYTLRFRRILRPYFLAVNNTMLKKTLKCIRNTLPEIASVLTLLLLHIYFFMMVGMLLFPQVQDKQHQHNSTEFNNTEWKMYFNSLDKAFTSLLVLLTTANNPDVMMPAYSQNRLYAIFFIVFSFIGTFLMFNLVTAVVYNQFRGYFQNSMQASYFRRCVAASAVFEILLGIKDCTEFGTSLHSSNNASTSLNQGENVVNIKAIKHLSKLAMVSQNQRSRINDYLEQMVEDNEEEVINHREFKILLAKVDISPIPHCENEPQEEPSTNESQPFLDKLRNAVRHKNFDLIGNVVVLVNAVFVTVEIAIHYEAAFKDVRSRLNIINYIFVCYYSIEQIFKIWAYRMQYFKKLSSIYDGVLTITLIVMEIVQISRFEHVSTSSSMDGLSVWDCARIVNILIFLRLLRVIPNIRPMANVTSVLIEIVHNLASFVGVLVIIYYVFAIIGMMAFNHATDPIPTNGSGACNYTCGTYEQLNYWANNFNDFASSLVVLWDVMVVNNWHVFLTVYSRRVSPWSQLYFIAWWVVAVIITINLFIALILDHFIAKLDRPENVSNDAVMRMGRRGTVHALFHNQVHEPNRIEIMDELEKHPTIRGYLYNGEED